MRKENKTCIVTRYKNLIFAALIPRERIEFHSNIGRSVSCESHAHACMFLVISTNMQLLIIVFDALESQLAPLCWLITWYFVEIMYSGRLQLLLIVIWVKAEMGFLSMLQYGHYIYGRNISPSIRYMFPFFSHFCKTPSCAN
jgi:hypothetical protein